MYIRMTIALFKKRLKEGHYDNLCKARQAISRARDLNDEERDQARAAAEVHFNGSGDQFAQLLAAYVKINEGGKSWALIAKEIGVNVTTIHRFRAGVILSAKSMRVLEKGLKKYTTEVIEDIPKLKTRSKKVEHSSLIEHVQQAPAGLPSLLELQMRELELNRSLQQYHLRATPTHLNGARAR